MIELTHNQELALREIYAWGSHYPLRPEIMPSLCRKGLVRRILGVPLNIGNWEITPLGRDWVRENSL